MKDRALKRSWLGRGIAKHVAAYPSRPSMAEEKSPERRAAERALVQIAKPSSSTWNEARREMFRGETTVATGNTLYRFVDGIFSARAAKATPEAWESPPNLRDVELVGFLANERGLWTLAPRFRPNAMAVLAPRVRSADPAFTLTSPVWSCTIVALAPPPARTAVVVTHPKTERMIRVPAVMEVARRPAPPPTLTRIQPAPRVWD